MEGDGDSKLMEKSVLHKVGHAIACIDEAKNVDEVVLALYSLAACLFPLTPNSVSGSLDEKYRDKLFTMEVPSVEERVEWSSLFYKGSGFRAFSRVMLHDIASNWLSCFPTSARQCVFDVFFINGCATEIVQVLVPCLQQRGGGNHDNKAVCSNAERLIILCLLENDMVLRTANEFMDKGFFIDVIREEVKETISKAAQLITCIPDKARVGAPVSLSPHLFFKRIIAQLLHGLEVCDLELVDKSVVGNGTHLSGAVSFIGEVFSRICRRGSADVLLSEMIPQILGHVRNILSSTLDVDTSEMFESKSYFQLWSKIIEAVNDSHSVERIAEVLLHQLALVNVTDVEGYWTLWILFGQICKRQPSIRFIFMEKFLLWKEFPICCLRWILYFAVLECPPGCPPERNPYSSSSLSEALQCLLVAWSKEEFVQSCSTEKQAYVTAALGLCLEKTTKETLDATKESLHLILQGISFRMGSPVYLIRKMASSIALVFSKIVDPKNPLYLDEECQDDSIDWEFGLTTRNKEALTITDHSAQQKPDGRETCAVASGNQSRHNGIVITSNDKEISSNSHDPEEVIDPVSLNDESSFAGDNCGSGSEDSETSSNSSLQPYDLVDDDTDLKRKFSQLVDVVGALRKSDDAVGVENALDVVETLIRALPDELKYVAADLTKTLVQVRCFDSAIEGEEESAEKKRQKALVALLVACPVETLDSLNKLIYSPTLDISQRIMILDVMTYAAEELASARVLKSEQQHKPLITSTSDQPWFVPRNIGSPRAGTWKEIVSTGTPLNWSYSYERELPSKAGKINKGKTRRWSLLSGVMGNQMEWTQNAFPQHAAAFMLPLMQGFDKKRHGVDLLGRDFIVLGKLIYMLGVCMKCAAMHPEASVLASPLLDMLKSREICHHAEAYVRRSVLFAASCILLALHPSYVASAVVGGNTEISEGLEWVRIWALKVAESDTDRECHTLAMTCLQLHAEMALQASRALGAANDNSNTNVISLFPGASRRSIKIPYLNS